MLSLLKTAPRAFSPAATALTQAFATKSFITGKDTPAKNPTELERERQLAERYYPTNQNNNHIEEIAAGYWTGRGNPETSKIVADNIAQLSDENIKNDPVAGALKAEAKRLQLKPESNGLYKEADIAPYGEHLARFLRTEVLTPVANKASGDVMQSAIKRVLQEQQNDQNQGRGRG